ncbi:MAG: TIGR04376 family protein, partial [Cyanobacteria bacterium P01_F01_bin.42]
QILEDKLREQEKDTLRLLKELQNEEKVAQDAILVTAEEVKRWHQRVQKAQNAGRQDLAQGAQAREAQLLRQGNQEWAHMEMVKTRMTQAQALYQLIQRRRQEVQDKIKSRQTTAPKAAESDAWNQPPPRSTPRDSSDPLEEKFRQWEIEDDLESLRSNMGR